MAKPYYILHGFNGHAAENWFPWLKEHLEGKGEKVIVPIFPSPNRPVLKDWLATLKEEIVKHGEGTIVGHSLGGALAVRYLQQGGKPDHMVLVAAPFTPLAEIPMISSFLTDPFEDLKLGETRFTVIHSEDDPYVPVEHAYEWGNLLQTEPILFANRGHFGQATFPEIIGYLE